jgi:hypothetical protein
LPSSEPGLTFAVDRDGDEHYTTSQVVYHCVGICEQRPARIWIARLVSIVISTPSTMSLGTNCHDRSVGELRAVIHYSIYPKHMQTLLARASCGSSRKCRRSQPAKPGQQQRTTVSGDNFRALSLYVLVNPQSLELRASRLRSLSGRPKGQAFEFEGPGRNGLKENAPPRQR